jgi:integral membrane protein
MMNTIKIFRFVAIAEGISFLILLGIAMPLKYYFGMPDAVKIMGMMHGVLFVSFIMLAFTVMPQIKKGYLWLLRSITLSVIPFGTFILDRELKNLK